MFQKLDSLSTSIMLLFGIYLLIVILELLGSVLELHNLKLRIYISNARIVFKGFNFGILIVRFLDYLSTAYKSILSLFNILGSKFKINLIFTFITAVIAFLISIRGIFYIINYLLNFILNDKVSSYLALTIVLTSVAYFPNKLGFYMHQFFTSLLNLVAKKKKVNMYASQKEIDKLKSIIVFLRPKLWVYLTSIFLTIINSMEKISNSNILNNSLWLQLKPIIFESVLSMIVIDRFVNLFRIEYKKFHEQCEGKQLIQFINKKD